jgi:hypothetical protein
MIRMSNAVASGIEIIRYKSLESLNLDYLSKL